MLFACAALLLGLLAAVATLELLARAIPLDDAELEITFDPGTPAWARFDAAKGWANLAGRAGNNAQGFRFPRDYTRERARERRVALLGDSQVWGLGVEADEHVGVLLDARLESAEVYSFGVPGYGPVQELLLLRELLRDYEIDEVFAVAFVYNDLVDESVSLAYGGFQKPYFAWSGQRFTLENQPVPRPVLAEGPATTAPFFGRAVAMDFLLPDERLLDRSAIFRAIAQRASYHPGLARALARAGLAVRIRETATASDFYSIRRIDGRAVPCWHLEKCPDEHRLDGLEAATAAYVEMDRLCRDAGIRFAVVLTPSYAELEQRRFDVVDALARSLREQRIATLDAREVFRSQPDWRSVVGPDRHWTASGHRLVAESLYGAIASSARETLE